MLIKVEPQDSYDVEPGRHAAVCIDARELDKRTPDGVKRYLRVVWQLNGADKKTVRYLVGKNYEPLLAKGTELREDLDNWLGPIDARQFDTDSLKGKGAMVTVRHIHNEGRPKPFCFVSQIEALDMPEPDPYEIHSP